MLILKIDIKIKKIEYKKICEKTSNSMKILLDVFVLKYF